MTLRKLTLLAVTIFALNGCNDNDGNQITPETLFLPEGATSIEVVDGNIYYVNKHKLYRSTLDGESPEVIDDDYLDFPQAYKPQIFGLKSQVVSYDKSYQRTHKPLKNEFPTQGLNGFSNEDVIYAIKDNKIVAINDSKSYSEIDISDALSKLPDDIVLHTAIVDGNDLITSYSLAGDDYIQTALVVDGNFYDIRTSGEFVSAVKSENRETLFIQYEQVVYEFSYRTATLIQINYPNSTALTYSFTLNDIIYSSSDDMQTTRYDYRNSFSESYSFSEQLGQVRDVDSVDGIHYAATDNGIWVVDDELAPVKQLIKL